ncbi:MAG: host-nuclease inhibitor Gam family protein [Pseudomonadota bacterium]
MTTKTAKSRRAKGKTRTPSQYPVPQDQIQADATIAAIGSAQRLRTVLEAEMNDRIEAVKAEYAKRVTALDAEIADRTEGVQTWAEANRAALTNDGRTKTVRLTMGEFCWRNRPPSVRFRGKDAILEACKSLGLTQFIRITEELNRDAMLADPDKATGINGVSIGSAGEDFVVTPDETELEQVA